MPPAEMTFHNFDESMPKIVDFRAKWEEGSFEYENTIRHFPGDKLNPVLKQRIMDTALRCWNVFGLRGYARVDMRVDHNDNPFVIEVNANPVPFTRQRSCCSNYCCRTCLSLTLSGG